MVQNDLVSQNGSIQYFASLTGCFSTWKTLYPFTAMACLRCLALYQSLSDSYIKLQFYVTVAERPGYNTMTTVCLCVSQLQWQGKLLGNHF